MGAATSDRDVMYDSAQGSVTKAMANPVAPHAGIIQFFLSVAAFVQLSLDQFFDWLAIWTDIKKRPFITVGMLSFLGLIPLAVTSNKWSQRRLGRKWRQLHLLVYPITILAVLHFYMLVKLDELRPLVFAGCLGLLLGYRWLKKTFPAQ
jgi:sulfoxide reductase heme-binding subunit YedZ